MDSVSHAPSRNAGVDPDTFQRIEIITGIGRRRRWSPEDKALTPYGRWPHPST